MLLFYEECLCAWVAGTPRVVSQSATETAENRLPGSCIRQWPSFCLLRTSGGIAMLVSRKRFFVLASLLSWLWLLSGPVPMSAHAAVSGQTSPDRGDWQQSLPPNTQSPNNSVPNGMNQQSPSVLSPDTNTEPNHKLCDSPELVVAQCEPKPGSPLSASPLVLNGDGLRLPSAV